MWAFFVGDFMAIQKVDVTVPGGDTPRSANIKINANFSDTTHAASRLVGTEAGNVMQVGAFGLGSRSVPKYPNTTHPIDIPNGFFQYVSGKGDNDNIPPAMSIYATAGLRMGGKDGAHGSVLFLPYYTIDNSIVLRTFYNGSGSDRDFVLWHSRNTTKDANGFLKGASPIVKVFADKVELNDDAVNQNVVYKKNGIGDYTITTQSGLSTDGWYIELPKDMNGNPKVAVTLTEVDGVITLKTYKRIFSMETFTFEPDLDNPLDIPDGRWIDLRLNEVPVEEVNP